MALPSLNSSDSTAATRDKINAAIAAVSAASDAVSGLQDFAAIEGRDRVSGDAIEANARSLAISTEAQARSDGDQAESNARAAADEAEANARIAGDAAAVVAALTAIAGSIQPGTAPHAFSSKALGAIGDLPPLDPDAVVATALGTAWRMDGAAVIAPRVATLIDPDAIWVVQARYWRLVDVLDPNNNAVDFGLQWLDRFGADAGTTLLHRETSLRVQDGPRRLSFRVPSIRGGAPIIKPPSGAVSWRTYLRTYGSDGATAVSFLGARDATFAGLYAPDVTDIAARLSRIEGQLTAGLPLTAPILPSYAVADLPPPGNRGRKAFALDGRAPNAAGALEAANAGTGVEVTDNGRAWVITGTNQQVQA